MMFRSHKEWFGNCQSINCTKHMIRMVFHLRWIWEGVLGLENGLIYIWTERCPNEAIWKQICNSFGKVYLGSKMA